MNDNKMLDKQSPSSQRTNIAFGIIGTSFIGTIALISPFITMQLRSPLPYMATPRTKIIQALEYIAKQKQKENGIVKPLQQQFQNQQVQKRQLRYYDLGSGDGETVLAAGSQGWKSTGIELNSTLWGLSSLRKLTSPSLVRRQCNFVWGNMWAYGINDADAVMIFGVKPLMPKIAKKINNECQPGTFVMSYRFLIPCQTETEIITEEEKKEKNDDGDDEVEKLDATLVYDKDEMRIYKLSSSNK